MMYFVACAQAPRSALKCSLGKSQNSRRNSLPGKVIVPWMDQTEGVGKMWCSNRGENLQYRKSLCLVWPNYISVKLSF